MDVVSLDLVIFLLATFAGALVAGLSGFAFGLVAASIWLSTYAFHGPRSHVPVLGAYGHVTVVKLLHSCGDSG